MIAEDFRYYRGSAESRETVELDEVRSDGIYITTCAVNLDLLMCGIPVHPCGNGDDRKLAPDEQLKVLEFAQAERKKIIDRYPVKTYEGWRESGFPTFEDYCRPGDTVDEAMVDYFVNSVPPITLRSDCTQAGEAYNMALDPDTEKYRSTYTTFSRLTSSLWRFEGYCFVGQTNNRAEVKTRLERRIAVVRKELTYD